MVYCKLTKDKQKITFFIICVDTYGYPTKQFLKVFSIYDTFVKLFLYIDLVSPNIFLTSQYLTCRYGPLRDV